MDDKAFSLIVNKIDSVDRRIDTLHEKVDDLIGFKWKVYGVTMIVSTMLAVAIQVFIVFLNKEVNQDEQRKNITNSR